MDNLAFNFIHVFRCHFCVCVCVWRLISIVESKRLSERYREDESKQETGKSMKEKERVREKKRERKLNKVKYYF